MVTRRRVWIARSIALLADAAQWVWMPLMFVGAASPFDDVLDVVVGGGLVWLLGWHWSFVPTFIAELIPAVDLVPTWTLAVWLATRDKKPALPEESAAAR